MFESKTVVIVGAGAGCDINMPLGKDLLTTIAKQIDIKVDHFGTKAISGDQELYQCLRLYLSKPAAERIDADVLNSAVRAMARSLPQAISIDNYLDNHSDDPATLFMGKLAIVNAIVKAERSSKFYFQRNHTESTIESRKSQDTWHAAFFRKLCEGVTSFSKLEESFSKLTFVIFNYDRCLEHFLFETIKTFWRQDNEATATLLSQASFFHPYGSLGNLPWQDYNNSFSFGGGVQPEYLLNAYSKIKIFTEQIRDDTTIDQIKSAVSEAKTIIFLGFAFHDQNIRLLSPKDSSSVTKVFATGINVSPQNLVDAQETLFSQLNLNGRKPWSDFNSKQDCKQLIENNWRLIGK